jgi:RloB-like protein
MGEDNQPKHRQRSRELKRRTAKRAPIERLLIVCEGKKTEPQYITEIRTEFRLSTANVQVLQSELGTQPLQVVEYAEQLFLYGDRSKAIEPFAFDRVISIFDRDDHPTYHNALSKVKALNGKKLENDLGEAATFIAIASVPCFEVWLLLHFEDIQAPIHRDEVYSRLRSHIIDYDKGRSGYWAVTKPYLEIAINRAKARAQATSAHDGTETCTLMFELVALLTQLKD